MPRPSSSAQSLPTGTVTFCFTDIEGSTRLLQALGSTYIDLLSLHNRRMRAAIEAGGGTEIGTEGDSFFIAFPSAHGALVTAVEAQRALHAGDWPDEVAVRVRMGLHTGEGRLAAGSYVGMDVHRAARISAAAHGGQVLLSATTAGLVRAVLPAGVALRGLGEHQLKDLDQPEELHQLVIDGLPFEFPPLRSLVHTPHNLPTELASLVGRETELVEVAELVRSSRLSTLTGPGGSGKTRLAVEVAHALLDEFPGGVWLAELAPIRDPGRVAEALGTVIGVQSGAARTMSEALVDVLRTRRSLVILDNCEHLLEGCARLATMLLAESTSVHVLATSRQPLGVRGEFQYPVPTLGVPRAGDAPPVAELRAHPAVQLFEERTAALRPGFAVTQENAPAVGEIVRRLDGIPLAIELAAARVKFLSPTEVAAHLDDRFGLLQGSGAGHQTLRAVMDWSYELLSDSEQLALERLSVFVGGWTLEGAEFLATGYTTETSQAVLDLLAGLVDKSLVMVTEQGGESRYHMLETVREYGWQRLKERGEHDPAILRHRLWCLQLAERALAHFWSAEMARWLHVLEQEHDNLRAAVDRATDAEGVEVGLRICGALWAFWDVRGHIREGLERLEHLLTRPQVSATSAEARARAMDAAAWLAGLGGDFERAMAWSEPAVTLWRDLGDRTGAAWSLSLRGMLTHNLGRSEQAGDLFTESLALAEEGRNPLVAAWALFGLGHVALDAGDVERAEQRFRESLDLSRQLRIPWGSAWAAFSLGVLALTAGDYEPAEALLRESLALRWTLGDRRTMSDSLDALASLAGLLGSANEAALLDGAAEALREATGAPLLPWLQPKLDEGLEAARAILGSAAFESARERGRAMPLERAVKHALTERGVGGETLTRVG